MWVVPIRVEPVEIHIHSDRRLAFQVLIAFWATQPNGSSSKVLRDVGARKLVEFRTLIPAGGSAHKVLRTVRRVGDLP
jgi:hypothetical protein